MSLTDPAFLSKVLARNGASPKHALGQHFLVSDHVVDAILKQALPACGILEIGPGPGVLTSPLSMRVPKLIAYEIDPLMQRVLTETAPAAQVRGEDALKVSLADALEELPTPRAVVSNLPYYITGPLLGKIAEAWRHWDWAVLMMQKEVGDRILAPAGNSARGSLSVWIQSEFKVTRIADVPPTAFHPPPKVQSVVLRLDPAPSGRTPEFFALVREGFAQPRKTLSNNLKGRGLGVSLLEEMGLSGTIRPHQLTHEHWDRLLTEL